MSSPWWKVALSEEITSTKPFAVDVGDQPVVAYQIRQKLFKGVKLAADYQPTNVGEVCLVVRKGDAQTLERLNTSPIDWRLLCPGPMVDQAALGIDRLRIAADKAGIRGTATVSDRRAPDTAGVGAASPQMSRHM